MIQGILVYAVSPLWMKSLAGMKRLLQKIGMTLLRKLGFSGAKNNLLE